MPDFIVKLLTAEHKEREKVSKALETIDLSRTEKVIDEEVTEFF